MDLEVGDLMYTQVRGFVHGQRVINTFWHYCTVPGTGNNVVDAAAEFMAQWLMFFDNAYTSMLSEDYHSGTVRCQFIRPNGTEHPIRYAYVQSPLTPQTGQVEEPALPASNAAVMRRRTVLAGRQYRGRIYIPGVPMSYVEESVFTQDGYDAISDAFSPIVIGSVAYSDVEWAPCITDAPLHSTITAVTSVTLDDVIRVQRRREVGVGE